MRGAGGGVPVLKLLCNGCLGRFPLYHKGTPTSAGPPPALLPHKSKAAPKVGPGYKEAAKTGLAALPGRPGPNSSQGPHWGKRAWHLNQETPTGPGGTSEASPNRQTARVQTVLREPLWLPPMGEWVRVRLWYEPFKPCTAWEPDFLGPPSPSTPPTEHRCLQRRPCW